jgi:hypothetical protein
VITTSSSLVRSGLLRWRIGLGVATGAVVVGGLALGWPSLVAIGIAPLLLSLLPCLAMCALGICMMGRGSRSCSQERSGDAAATNSADALTGQARASRSAAPQTLTN